MWLYSLSRLTPVLRAMRHSERDRFNPTPLYLVGIPLAAVVFQIAAAPLTAFSRARPIASSAEMIAASRPTAGPMVAIQIRCYGCGKTIIRMWLALSGGAISGSIRLNRM